MRCLSCDCALSDKEATRKYASSGTFIDLCDDCFAPVADEIPVIQGKGNKEQQPQDDCDG